MQVGEIAEIWRYPVKSMGGERLASVELCARGMLGDRVFAVRDVERGELVGAKKIPELMRLAARTLVAPSPDGEGAVAEITLPDRSVLRTDAADPEELSRLVGSAVGREVTLHDLHPASDLDHYRRAAPDAKDPERELRQVLGRTEDEPLPDFSGFPAELEEFATPPGTYFDAYPILILTDASLAALAALVPDSRVDVRRFRPNLLVRVPDELTGFVEAGWEDRRLRIGDALLRTTAPCGRCVMTTLGFSDLPQDPSVLRAIVKHANQNLGIYATVEAPGRVAMGAKVELLDAVAS